MSRRLPPLVGPVGPQPTLEYANRVERIDTAAASISAVPASRVGGAS